MKNSIASAAALVVALTVSLPQAAHADSVSPPPVPDGLEITDESTAFLVGHAIGTQNYICLPSGTGFAWTLFTPQATLFTDDGRQVITHFFSPNPDQEGAIRATWEDSRDTSTVWAQLVPGGSSTDSKFVADGAIAWLKLEVVGAVDAATGDLGRSRPGVLTGTTFVQRLNTSGGSAPATGCSLSTDVGKKAFVPYTADYFFYKHPGSESEDENGR